MSVYRPGFHNRQQASLRRAEPLDPRAAWVKAINMARDLAGRARGAVTAPAGSADLRTAAAALWRLTRDLRAFPMSEAPAAQLEKGFRAAVEGFALVAGGLRGELAATPMRAMAEALDAMLDERRIAEAEGDRRRYPD